MVKGDPGMGKSVSMRLLKEKLRELADVSVGELTHPQSSVGDFYRELGHLFGVSLTASNRWGGFKALRERFRTHIEATLYRPVLLIDEAQSVRTNVFTELRILSSVDFDSKNILTVVIAGDQRLADRFQELELLPLASRIRARLILDPPSKGDLLNLLEHVIEQAGNPHLMTTGLKKTLVDHSLNNIRILMSMSNDLLLSGAQQEVKQLDEKLFLEVVQAGQKGSSSQRKRSKRVGSR